MRITLVAIGKTTDKYIADGFEKFANRINRYCKFTTKIIPELKNTKSMPVELQQKKEGDLILEEMKNHKFNILLDEAGKQFSSVEFAKWIEKRMIGGENDIAFYIGGPYGFTDEVKNKCQALLSISKMTFSHQIIRVIFAEQLYRAFTIIKGEPYHNS
ncbi:MAG: rRNA (pseudouridine1915-N3)-methyltransferase [Tenuifilum sp.]|jgi:23S rRNA (pseudouridine1915-N3)-methyltransferase|uniref:23S rRNA (pseudouridine(1915)-N(3))-methyltransferase RlmH n=1 Tax=Tenuifilum sp. TaxID=2760880 RepID=UPI0024ABFF32|nr:23S rRNA (pseudouridine(1915)-N(3))-methyltransferase RlmH [Tenuifilum sp.]MDI3527163.1 rRNA (pseudouridine1915-N3)-methyltransferase [Tenuifilum sp.]